MAAAARRAQDLAVKRAQVAALRVQRAEAEAKARARLESNILNKVFTWAEWRQVSEILSFF